MQRFLWVLALLSLLYPWGSEAATINAANCSPSTVQSAINSASIGDTVHLPTCTQVWDDIVTINKRIILEGNGTANTILNRQEIGNTAMFEVQGVTGFEMRNMTLDGTFDTSPNAQVDTGVLLTGSCVDFRLHHMTIRDLAQGIRIEGNPTVQRGVIDHNTFDQINYTGGAQGSFGYGVVVFGNGTYPALSLGTATNVFVEDNTFTDSREAMDANDGARFVFRYNTSTNNGASAAHVATHGWESGGPFAEGTRQIEVYNNTLANTEPKYGGVAVWGGDGVIFNNTFGALITEQIQLRHQDCAASYPYKGQIRDLYLWNNTKSGGGAADLFNGCTALVQLNRDYFLAVKAGYTPYTYPHPLTGALSAAPTIAITAPTAGTTYTTSTSPLTPILAGTASDDAALSAGSVTWSCTVCGSGTASVTGAGTNNITWSVPSITLQPGVNIITVTVTDADSQTASDSLTVTYNAPPDYATGLVMHLPLDNGSGTTATDVTGNGHPGTLSGGFSWSAGHVGTNAVTLNGTTGQIDVSGLLGTPGAVTLAAWVNLTALPEAENNIVSLGDYALIRQTATMLDCAYYAGSNTWLVVSAPVALVGAGWHHLVCTFEVGAQAAYVNGASTATGAETSVIAWTGLGSGTVIGNHAAGGSFHLQGSVDSVRVYNRALRATDVQALYTAESTVVSTAAPVLLRVTR